MTEFKDLLGKTIVKIIQTGDEDIEFILSNGTSLGMRHDQDCCENVYIESITGDLKDLIGSPILQAEESISDNPEANEVGQWTFYKLATINGYVDIRWNGESNGYYSISVDLYNRDKKSIESYLTQLQNRSGSDKGFEIWELDSSNKRRINMTDEEIKLRCIEMAANGNYAYDLVSTVREGHRIFQAVYPYLKEGKFPDYD